MDLHSLLQRELYCLLRTQMHCLFKITLVLISVVFWKIVTFDCVRGISETFLCLTSPLLVKTVLLDSLQVPLLSAGLLTYLRPKSFPLIVFYNRTLLIIKILIVFSKSTCKCSSHLTMVAVIQLPELLYCLSNTICFVFLLLGMWISIVFFFYSSLLYNWPFGY
jgi:hypothetical protein